MATKDTQAPQPSTGAAPDAKGERQRLLDAQRAAHRNEPDSFKDEALNEKVVHIEHGGTGPSSTESMDTDSDQQQGSGNPRPGRLPPRVTR